MLNTHDVYLVFDRYKEFSTKGVTRTSRGSQGSRVHQLTISMPIPTQKAILSIPENKRQLISLIVADLCDNVHFPDTVECDRKLVVTGEDPIPIELTPSATIQRRDIKTTHEEADNILVQQMVQIAAEQKAGVAVVSDDTDVFVLLLYFYLKYSLTVPVVMESPVQDRASIDIRATVHANKDIIHDLPAAHALTGSDTTACYYGVGKGTVVKVLRSQAASLSSVGELNSRLEDILKQSTQFVAACYNVTTDESDMSSVRQRVWASKVGKAQSCAPKLCSLPPTSEAFAENVKRANLQACIWKHADQLDPPDLDPIAFGWEKCESSKSLDPVMLPDNIPLAPENILRLIKCSCESQSACVNLRCRCNSSRLSCTIFCACQGSALCCNEHTKNA